MTRAAPALALFATLLVGRQAAADRPPTPGPSSAPAVVKDSPGVPFLARLVARGFFNGLLGGDVAAMLPLCGTTVDFDGERLDGRPAIEARLRRLVTRARQRRLSLQRLVLLDARDMRRRFGAAPPRIAGSVRRGSYFALARLNQLGVVAVLARQGRFFRVVALTD